MPNHINTTPTEPAVNTLTYHYYDRRQNQFCITTDTPTLKKKNRMICWILKARDITSRPHHAPFRAYENVMRRLRIGRASLEPRRGGAARDAARGTARTRRVKCAQEFHIINDQSEILNLYNW